MAELDEAGELAFEAKSEGSVGDQSGEPVRLVGRTVTSSVNPMACETVGIGVVYRSLRPLLPTATAFTKDRKNAFCSKMDDSSSTLLGSLA